MQAGLDGVAFFLAVKFERDRQMFDQQEMELLKEVRRLRQKLATDNRNKRPPPISSSGDC